MDFMLLIEVTSTRFAVHGIQVDNTRFTTPRVPQKYCSGHGILGAL